MVAAKVRRTLLVAAILLLAVSATLTLRQARRVSEPHREPEPPTVPCITLPEQTGWVQAVAFSPKGDLLALAVSEGVSRGYCQLWDLAAGRVRTTLGQAGGAVTALAFSQDGQQLATGTGDGKVTIWDVASGAGRPLKGIGHHRLWQLVFSPEGKFLAGGSYFDVTLWDLTRDGAAKAIPGRFPLAFTADGKILTGERIDGDAVPLGDVAANAARQPAAYTMALAFAPNGTTWIREDRANQGTVHVWDSERRQPLARLAGHEQVVNAVTFSPDSKAVATASNDRTVQVWDVANGRPLNKLTGHTGAVYCVAFSPDGRWLASGGFDKTVRLWHLAGTTP